VSHDDTLVNYIITYHSHMDLERRVAELERRLALLEKSEPAVGRPAEGTSGDFWALEGLRAKFAELGIDAGGVLFTGDVRVPDGRRYEWQYGLAAETLLSEDWAEAAESFAALGHPMRLRLLREILGGRRTVAEMTELDGVGTTGQVYHHLQQLSAAGWLHTTARGRYDVPAGRVVPLMVMLTATRR